MFVRVDPDELVAVADVLRSGAIEAADIGTGLWSCVQCAMPSDIRGVVDQIVGSADRALDVSAGVMSSSATDLMNRAQVARTDVLAAATVSAAAPPSGAAIIGGTPPIAMTMTNVDGSPADFSLFGPAVIGGTPPIAMTITNVDGSPADFGSFGTAVIGGTPPLAMTITNPDGTPANFGSFGPAVIGGTMLGTSGVGAMDGVMALAQVGQNMRERAQARIDAIVSNPNSSGFAVGLALNAQGRLGYGINHLLAPSVTALEDQYGPLTDSAIRSLSPYTLPPEGTIFDGLSSF
jgi:hypothetical protein